MPSAQVVITANFCWQSSRGCKQASRRARPVSAFRTCPLPTGETVAYISKPDVAFLYREVYEKQSYLQHGVTIAPGNTVLDVGANIGLFAAFAAQKVGLLGHVVAVEPIPMTCDVLIHNTGTMLREGDARVTIINKGVGDGVRETVEFTFYPAAAGWSTMYQDDTEVSDAMDIFLKRSLPTLDGMDATLTNRVASLAARIAPNWLFENISRLAVNRMLADKMQFTCPLTTVSTIMKTEGLQCVDLLKIDVERAELDVLRGIADEDWCKIRQLVMEVHDDKTTLNAIRELLYEKGSFAKCVVEQDSQLKGSTLYNLYALQE